MWKFPASSVQGVPSHPSHSWVLLMLGFRGTAVVPGVGICLLRNSLSGSWNHGDHQVWIKKDLKIYLCSWASCTAPACSEPLPTWPKSLPGLIIPHSGEIQGTAMVWDAAWESQQRSGSNPSTQIPVVVGIHPKKPLPTCKFSPQTFWVLFFRDRVVFAQSCSAQHPQHREPTEPSQIPILGAGEGPRV